MSVVGIVPTVVTYAVNQKYANIDNGIQSVPFFPFLPTPVPCGRRKTRNQTLAEFLAFYTAILATVDRYQEAWVAQTVYTDCNVEYVLQGGIIYKVDNTWGIWEMRSNAFTILHPPARQRTSESQWSRIDSPGTGTNTPPSGGPTWD